MNLLEVQEYLSKTYGSGEATVHALRKVRPFPFRKVNLLP